MKNRFSIYLFFVMFFCCNEIKAQYTWVQKNDFGGMVRFAPASFSIGSKGYFVAGFNTITNVAYNDTWEYNPVSDSWTQKANLNGVARYAPSAFSIGNFGYVGCGWTSNIGTVQLKDFHKYDPINNAWTNIPDLPGAPRYTAFGISDGAKGYVGLGYTPLKDDFYAYDPVSNSWSTLPNFPGGVRQSACVFCISGIIYVCGGADASNALNDLWAYDPTTITWMQKTSIPGIGRCNSVGFSINGKGFVGSGYDYPTTYSNAFYIYDPISNSWTPMPPWPANVRFASGSFTINNMAYVGCGSHPPSNQCFKDLWSFGSSVLAPSIKIASSDSFWCDKAAIDFYDLSTNNPTSWQWYFPGATPDTSTSQNPIGIYYAASGSYDVTLVSCNGGGCDSVTYPSFIKEFNPPPAPTVTQSYDTLWSSQAYSYKWYNVAQPGNLLSINQYLVLYQPGSYFVIISDSNGCITPSSSYVFTSLEDLNTTSSFVSYYDNLSQNIVVEVLNEFGNRNFKIEVTDISARKVYSGDFQNGARKIEISASNCTDGVYLVKVFNEHQIGIQKVLKK